MNGIKPYEKYKPSGIAWLGNIPEHWEISKAKHILFQKKKTLNPNLNCGSISFGNIVFKDNERVPFETKATYQELLIGEFLINPLNLNFDLKSLRTGLSTIDVVVSTGYIVLQNNPKFNKRYLKWLLHQFDVSFMKTLGDGVRQTLSYNDFKNTNFPYISLSEQTTIARFLDYKLAKINRFIKKKKQLIKLLNEQKAAIINQAITKGLDPNAKMKDSGIEWLGVIPEHWEVRKLKYVAKILRGKFTPRPRNDPRYYDGEYPFIQTGNLTSTDKYITTYTQSLNELGYEVSKEFPINTVVMSVAANIADIAILNFKACFPDSVIGFKPFDNVDVDFLFYSLKNLRQEFFKIAIKSTQYNLNVDRVANVKIFLPDLSEQQQIVSFIEKETEIINTTISKIEKELALTEEYKTALIAEAVTGKIDVRGYEEPEISEEETYEEIEEEISMAAEDAEEYQTLEE